MQALRILILFPLVSALSGCASSPATQLSLEYNFWLAPESSPQPEFRITYFRPSLEWFKKHRQSEDPLLNDHLLFTQLEKELDQRQLCLEGYQILERRNTAKGRTFSGRCR